MAADSPSLEAKSRVEYFFEIAARSYLTRCDGARVPFRWMINPYRGCEFGWKYCYARYAHEFSWSCASRRTSNAKSTLSRSIPKCSAVNC